MKKGWTSKKFLRSVFAAGLVLMLSQSAFADRKIEKDLDEDGTMDQVLIYGDDGIIKRVENDADHDGFTEKLQVYENGKLVRLERDTDHDQKIDCIDSFKAGRRFFQKQFDSQGNLCRQTFFDDKEQIRRMEKDTTGDLHFDSWYEFVDGRIVSSKRDTNANQVPDVWTRYQKQMPVEQKEDKNEDGIIDRIISFDDQGRIKKISSDPFGKGKFSVTGFFENGSIKLQHRDKNQDSRTDTITRYENEQPVRQEIDSNFDGVYDVITLFVKGVQKSRKKDTDYDGQWDMFYEFDDKGELKISRQDLTGDGKINRVTRFQSGEPFKIETDEDGNGIFENIALLKNQIAVQTLLDKNQDGRVDTRIFFNARGEKKKLVSDTNFDGKDDVWQTYNGNILQTLEQDQNHDGKVDLKATYKKGIKAELLKDGDFNGYFETRQVYTDPNWTLVVYQDANADKHFDIISFFSGKILRKKRMDEDLDGTPDVVEYYSIKGVLEKIEELNGGKPSITWFYGEKEALLRGEEDRDLDGRTDVWYFYENKILARVQEDTNKDGKPDLWEVYDETQAVVKREKDLDFDGSPDFTDQVDKSSI